MGAFTDGLKNFVSGIVNRRDPIAQNGFTQSKLSDVEKRAIYTTGIGNKIVRLKAGYALKDTLQFESTEDEKFYRKRLDRHVKESARWAIAFGRGIIVLHRQGDDLREPLGQFDPMTVRINVFSGDMVVPGDVDLDLKSPRYFQPRYYMVRGYPIHHSRVVDVTYVKPPELDAPDYRYGGIGEFDLIYDQLVADGLVQRASPRVLEKASTLFYKVKGFKEAMTRGQESDMVQYFGRLEDVRGIHSAGLIDAEDELEVVTQNLSNLADADQITLRRLAMVTGIPLALLIGENVKGLNSTGDNERQAFQEMIETLQSEYLIEPINRLMRLCKQGEVWFRENQGETPSTRIEYETKAIANAAKLFEMGEDFRQYLEEKDVIQPDDFSKMFQPPSEG